MAPKQAKQDSRTKTRGAKHLPEEALKNVVDELNSKLQAKEQERQAAEESRIIFQLERDTIESLWSITKTEVAETKAQLHLQDREAEEVDQRHQVEIKVYKQKVKHLLYEHQNEINALKLQIAAATEQAAQSCHAQQEALANDNADLKQQLRQQAIEAQDALDQARLEARRDAGVLRQEAITKEKDLAGMYESRLEQVRSEIDSLKKEEITAMEEATSLHVQKLVDEHARAFGELRTFFTSANTDCLDCIEKLRAELAEAKRTEAAAEARAAKLFQENKLLVEPLEMAQKDSLDLKLRSKECHELQEQNKASRLRLAAAKAGIKDLEWKNELLEQRLSKLDSRDMVIQKLLDAKILTQLATLPE